MTVVFKRNVFQSISNALADLDAAKRWEQKKQYLSATLDVDLEAAQVFMLAIATRHHLIGMLREKKIPRELANNIPAILLLSRKFLEDEETHSGKFTLANLLKAQRAMLYGVLKSNLSYGLMLALEELRIWVEIYEQNKFELKNNKQKSELTLSFTYFQRERKLLPQNNFPIMTRNFYEKGLTSKNGKSFECRFDYFSPDIKLVHEHLIFLIDQVKHPLAERFGLLNNFKRQIQTFEKAMPSYQQDIFQKVAEDLRGRIFSFLENIPTGNTMLPSSIFAEAKSVLDISDVRQKMFVEEVVRFAKQDLNPRKPMFADLDAVYKAIGQESIAVLDVFLHKLEASEKDRMIQRLLVMNETNILMLVDKMRTTLNQKGIDPSKAKVADIMEVTFSDPWRSIDALIKAIQMKGVKKADCRAIEQRIYSEAERLEITSLKYLLRMKDHYKSDLDKFIAAATKVTA